MFEVGSEGFVYDDEGWCSARVLLCKKGGWHLLVTENGNEINRQAGRMYETPRAVFDYLVTRAIVRSVLFKGDSITPSIQQGKCYCSAAAFWFLKLSGCNGESLKKLHDLWTICENNAEFQSVSY